MGSSKEVAKLLAQLEKCDDRTSSEARSIRKKLRDADHYVSGGPREEKKSDVKKAKGKVSKKSKRVYVDDEEEDEEEEE